MSKLYLLKNSSISLQVELMVRLKFELASYNYTVQHISYNTPTPPSLIEFIIMRQIKLGYQTICFWFIGFLYFNCTDILICNLIYFILGASGNQYVNEGWLGARLVPVTSTAKAYKDLTSVLSMGLKIHWLYPQQRGKSNATLSLHPMVKLQLLRSVEYEATPSLPLLSFPPGIVVPVKVPSMG